MESSHQLRVVVTTTVKGRSHSLHAARVQVAAGRGQPDQTGREGQQQSVAAPVQSERQELASLRGVLPTPRETAQDQCGDMKHHKEAAVSK